MKKYFKLPINMRSLSYRMLSLMGSCSFCLFLTACSKDQQFSGTASLLMFNGVVGSNTLVTNFNGGKPIKWYKDANTLIYGETVPNEYITQKNEFLSYSGPQYISLFEYPDTTAHSKPVFDLHFNLQEGTVYSLFLTGTAGNPDTLFTRDELPYHRSADSTMGFRFVNIAGGDLKLSINLQGKAAGSEVASLGYKEVTAFKNYQVNAANDNYVFEIRDTDNGNLLLTYPLNVGDFADNMLIRNGYRYRNFTLIIFGDPAATGFTALKAAHTKNF